MLAYRTHEIANGCSPAYLAFGQDSRLPSEALRASLFDGITETEKRLLIERRANELKDLTKHRAEAGQRSQHRMQQRARAQDERYIERGLDVGQQVLLFRLNRANKLEPVRDGPFWIGAISSHGAHQLQPPMAIY